LGSRKRVPRSPVPFEALDRVTEMREGTAGQRLLGGDLGPLTLLNGWPHQPSKLTA
jgi:hypothetical protein